MGQFGFIALFIIGALALMAIIGIAAFFAEKKRTEQFQQAAGELSFEFFEADHDLLARLGGLQLFSQGRSRKMKNVLRGTSSDTEVSIFDYQYTTGSGKNSTTHKQTAISFHAEKLSLPNFELRPERWYHKIGSMLGYEDIDFEDYPDFSRRYLLKSDDEMAVRDVFTAEVIEYLQSHDEICAEGHGDRLVVYRANKRVKPLEVRQFLETGFGVYAALAHTRQV